MARDDPRRAVIRTEALPRLFVRLSAPALVVTALHGLNVLVDAVYAGHLIGTDAVAALGVVHTLNHVVFSVEALVATGAAAAMSIAVGSGDRKAERETFAAVVLLSAAVSVLIVGLGLLFARDALAYLGLRAGTLEMGWQYYRIYLAGSVFVIYAFCTGALLQARGDLARMTANQAVGLVTTAVATPVLIVASGMGLAGAAAGTVAGAAIAGYLNTVALLRGRSAAGLLRTSRTIVVRVLAVGQSGMLLQLGYFAQSFLVFRVLARLGSESDLALMGATYRLVLFGVYLATGFSRALQPVAGINFGAGDGARVTRAFLIFNAGALAVIAVPWLLAMASPAAMLQLVAPGLPVSDGAAANFRTYLLVVPVLPFLLTSLTLYQAIGLAWQVTVLGLVRMLVLFVPAILLAPGWFGIAGVYYSLAWMDIALAVILGFNTLFVVRPRLSTARPATLPVPACS